MAADIFIVIFLLVVIGYLLLRVTFLKDLVAVLHEIIKEMQEDDGKSE